MTDQLAVFFAGKTARRALIVTIFAVAAVAARGLIVFFISWALFETLVETMVQGIIAKTAVKDRRRATSIAAWVILAAGTLVVWFGASAGVRAIAEGARELPAIIEEIWRLDVVQKALAWWPGKSPATIAAEHAGAGLLIGARLGRGLVFLIIGAIVAVVHTTERSQTPKGNPQDILPTIARWTGYAREGVIVMLRTQLLVSLVNAILTFPILVVLGIPRAATLTLVVFVAGLVPVLGNVFSGTVLALMAYAHMGPQGVVIVIALTAVLHKIESYYINPRIASKHIKAGNTGIIISMLIWERIAGIAGLFISLPTLYLCQRIREEWEAEDKKKTSGTLDETALSG